MNPKIYQARFGNGSAQAWDWRYAQQLLCLDHIGISAMISGCYCPIMLQSGCFRVLAFVCMLGLAVVPMEVIRLYQISRESVGSDGDSPPAKQASSKYEKTSWSPPGVRAAANLSSTGWRARAKRSGPSGSPCWTPDSEGIVRPPQSKLLGSA